MRTKCVHCRTLQPVTYKIKLPITRGTPSEKGSKTLISLVEDKMEAAAPSCMFVPTHHLTRRHVPEDRALDFYSRENVHLTQ